MELKGAYDTYDKIQTRYIHNGLTYKCIQKCNIESLDKCYCCNKRNNSDYYPYDWLSGVTCPDGISRSFRHAWPGYPSFTDDEWSKIILTDESRCARYCCTPINLLSDHDKKMIEKARHKSENRMNDVFEKYIGDEDTICPICLDDEYPLIILNCNDNHTCCENCMKSVERCSFCNQGIKYNLFLKEHREKK